MSKRETRPCVVCGNTWVVLPEVTCTDCKSSGEESFPVDCKVSQPLKMYMGFWRGAGSSEGACLIFAHNYKEAKKLAFGVLSGGSSDTEWIDVGINLIKNSDYLYKEANQ